jgi:hypothetical protein
VGNNAGGYAQNCTCGPIIGTILPASAVIPGRSRTRSTQLSTAEFGAALPVSSSRVCAVFAASLLLGACAATTPHGDAPTGAPTAAATPAASSGGDAQRDLTPQEKKIVTAAVSPSLKNPGAAKYRWSKFPLVPPADDVAYCATVDAQSPYAAYNGRQAYIVDVKVTGGHITAATLGLITGGKDIPIVSGMCAEHGLDPNKAT